MEGREGLVEVAFVRVQKRTSGHHFVTIPSEAVKDLDIEAHERMKVYLDKKMKRVVFELV